jgi:hypothetical protein
VGVVFLPSGEFRSYTIEHEDEKTHLELGPEGCHVCTDQRLMLEAGEEFMARLRLELPPPDPDASMATLAAVRVRFTRQPGKQATIDHTLAMQWDYWKAAETEAEQARRAIEITMREQAGEAAELIADDNGELLFRRVVSDQNVKAHTRHMDYLTRIKPKGDDE